MNCLTAKRFKVQDGSVSYLGCLFLSLSPLAGSWPSSSCVCPLPPFVCPCPHLLFFQNHPILCVSAALATLFNKVPLQDPFKKQFSSHVLLGI